MFVKYFPQMKNVKVGDNAIAFMPKAKTLTDKKVYKILWISTHDYIAVRNDNGRIRAYCKDNFWFEDVGVIGNADTNVKQDETAIIKNPKQIKVMPSKMNDTDDNYNESKDGKI